MSTNYGMEGQLVDYKSLRKVHGKSEDYGELARDCVCFANAAGGVLVIGVENGEIGPPHDQRIPSGLTDRIRKRVGEMTVNVTAVPELRTHENGGEYVALMVPRSLGVASTPDGRFFMRVGDDCRPVLGDDVMRLVNERPAIPWETLVSPDVTVGTADAEKLQLLLGKLRSSPRVTASVKEKSDEELTAHYHLSLDQRLTNLGVLLVGRSADRARLGTAPVVQALRYDERGVKIGKFVWDDHTLSPVELLDAIWAEVPDFRESYELPVGMLRVQVPAFDERVVRELLVNALVHRPYTQRGDIFLNLHPDRLEVVNPGRLPFGVTPRNILHQSQRRNDALARIFHDLVLMEREGSGFDLIYELLLSSGRAAPVTIEGADSVCVVVPRRVVQPGIAQLLKEADQRHQLTQRERITLGLLAQGEGMRAEELVSALGLSREESLKGWIGRLLVHGLVQNVGRARGTRYFVPPELMESAGLALRTTLQRVEPHRLDALIVEDLTRYREASLPVIHRRIAPEVGEWQVRRAFDRLVEQGTIAFVGDRGGRTYRLAEANADDP